MPAGGFISEDALKTFGLSIAIRITGLGGPDSTKSIEVTQPVAKLEQVQDVLQEAIAGIISEEYVVTITKKEPTQTRKKK